MKPLVDFTFFFSFSLNFDIVVFEIYLFSNRNEMLIFFFTEKTLITYRLFLLSAASPKVKNAI